jgi:Kef-type K+ transport system membrane component KefB/Trk K+ transport system NAD-binding subunit
VVAIQGDVFIQLGLVIIVAALAAFILRLIKQPQILAYVIVGILITPVFGLVTDTSTIESMSIIGIAFLLFLVGMEMDLKSLRNVAFVSTIGGGLQILVLFVAGYLLALMLGFLTLEAAYVGLMVAFSSTMVVMKLLADKHELNTLHGRIIVGILLMEDAVAIFAISILTSINDFNFTLFGIALLKFISLFAAAYIASKYFFPSIFKFSAKHQELLLIVSLAVCFIFSLAFQFLGFSLAIGAFVAGVAIGNLDYRLEIIGKVKSLRDFFSLLFFVSLGMGLSLAVIQKMWLPLVMILALIMIIKPIITLTITSLFRYTKKPAFLTANSLSQMGEFSLIIAAQGLALHHISQDLFSMIVIIAIVTITLTSYRIQYATWFFRIFEKPLRIFDIFTTEGLEYLPSEVKPKIVLLGYNRIGYSVLQGLHKEKKRVLVVDFNPEVISKLVSEGFHCIYGDVTDEEIIDRMNLSHLNLLISTVPDIDDNFQLIRKIRQVNKQAKIIVTASSVDQALRLYEHGASYVVLPHFLGGEHVSQIITKDRSNRIKLHDEKKKHIEHLKQRKRLKHEHPLH